MDRTVLSGGVIFMGKEEADVEVRGRLSSSAANLSEDSDGVLSASHKAQ